LGNVGLLFVKKGRRRGGEKNDFESSGFLDVIPSRVLFSSSS
jgi:hypothetical protein